MIKKIVIGIGVVILALVVSTNIMAGSIIKDSKEIGEEARIQSLEDRVEELEELVDEL